MRLQKRSHRVLLYREMPTDPLQAADIHFILKFSSPVPIHLIQLQAPWKTQLLLDKCYGWRKKQKGFTSYQIRNILYASHRFKSASKTPESLKHALKIHRTSLQLYFAADSCRGCRSPTSGDLH